jgi:stage II sporulation protein M
MSWIAQEWNILKENSRLIIGSYNATIALAISTFYLLRHHGVMTKEAYQSVSQVLHGNSLSMNGPKWEHFIKLFLNNSIVAFGMVGIGIIPLFIIPFIALNYQMIPVAVLIAFGYQLGEDPFLLVLRGVLPHGVFEITTIVIASVIGTRISHVGFEKLRNGEIRQAFILESKEKRLVKTFLRVVIPLLFIAAFVDTYITPVLLG